MYFWLYNKLNQEFWNYFKVALEFNSLTNMIICLFTFLSYRRVRSEKFNVKNQNCGRKTEKLLLDNHFTKCGTSEYGDYWPLVRSDKRGKQEDTQNNQYKCKNFAWTTAIEWIRAAFRVYTSSKTFRIQLYFNQKSYPFLTDYIATISIFYKDYC